MSDPIRIPDGPRMPFYGEGPYWTATWERMREDAQEVYGYEMGLEYCQWDQEWERLNALKVVLVNKFNEWYALRECAHETPQAMQHYLQRRLWEVGPRCEMMLGVYATEDIMKLGLGYDENTSFTEHGENEGTTATTSGTTSTFEDTPTSSATPVINNPTNRTRDDGEGSANTNASSDITRTTEHSKRQFDRQAVDYADELFRKWQDVQLLFIKGFEPLFLGTIERFGFGNI